MIKECFERSAYGFRAIMVGFALLVIGGCSHYYTPDPSRPFEPIDEFTSSASITLQNGQPSNTDELFFDPTLNVHSYYANYNKWTDVAIEIAAREMTKRGMKVGTGAPKWIAMSVVGAHTDVGFIKIETDITMTVKTSTGYTATYVGRNSSSMAADIPRQVDGALMRVVRDMLLDPQIVAFLKA